MVDPASGALVVRDGRRLSRQEAQMLREAMASGQVVVFADRHQWRHFQRYP